MIVQLTAGKEPLDQVESVNILIDLWGDCIGR
jgi:hypothetical protein